MTLKAVLVGETGGKFPKFWKFLLFLVFQLFFRIIFFFFFDRGEDKAALEVARRERKDLNNAKYDIYDVDEEKVWARIEEMDEWWKESTWRRLIQRELPDL